jgi:hypothetical protein
VNQEPASTVSSDEIEIPNGAIVRPELRKAVATIYSKYPDITVGEEYKVKGTLLHYTTHDKDGDQIKMITPIEYILDEDEDISFLFLTAEESNVVEATEANIDFFYNEVDIDSSYKRPENHTSYSYNEDAFAFKYRDKNPHVILEDGASISSIWTLDKKSNKISLYYKAD